ncbi:hypothetical protein SLE2022_005660 [Rubroshorea leprosula]
MARGRKRKPIIVNVRDAINDEFSSQQLQQDEAGSEIGTDQFAHPRRNCSQKLSSFLGTIARNSMLCPLNYEDWRDMPETTKADQMAYIKTKFVFSKKLQSWINKSLAKKWRYHKHKLANSKYFDPNKTQEENCRKTPPNVPPQQWQFLVKYFLSPEWKNLSNIGKKSRAQQKGFHTCGSKSFANKREEHLDDVGKIEFYRITHTLKNGNIVEEEAKRILNEAEATFENYKQENPDSSTKDLLKAERKFMSEVRGSERSGRVRGLGLGPTPTSIGISKAFSSKNCKLKKVKKELKDLKGQMSAVLGILKDAGLVSQYQC